MTLWWLERMRLWRTQRWLIVVSVYVVFGILGPLTAKFLPEILAEIDESAVSQLPEFTPEDGITQYMGNIAQLGLLAVAFVAASELAFDAKLEMAIFLRTRATVQEIFTPRFVTNAVLAIGAFVLGMACAYVGTGVLLGWVDFASVAVGSLLYALYLVLVVAVLGFFASLLRSVPAVALLTVATMIVIGVLGLVPSIAPWLPSELVGAIDALTRGGGFDFWRSTIVTLLLIALLVTVSIRRLEAREL